MLPRNIHQRKHPSALRRQEQKLARSAEQRSLHRYRVPLRHPSGKKYPVDPIPSEITEQSAQLRLHALQVNVVPEASFRADAFDPRLVGVDLPRMKIE